MTTATTFFVIKEGEEIKVELTDRLNLKLIHVKKDTHIFINLTAEEKEQFAERMTDHFIKIGKELRK